MSERVVGDSFWHNKIKEIEHFNKLTPAEAERLALLAEECAEVIQTVNKILRHGYESCNPLAENKITNRTLLEKEVGDLMFAIHFMSQLHNDLDAKAIKAFWIEKSINVLRWLHHHDDIC